MSVPVSPRVAALGPNDPRELGGYRLLGRLGSGGMGVVYVAVDRAGRHVAIKLVHHVLAGDAEFRQRFRREVSRARQVPPFCTAEVLDADLDHNPPYLVVEYIDGPSLDEVVRQSGPLSPSSVHSLAIGVATALTAIHGAGVIHRDLKPSNVLLAPGSPKVIDFGIAMDDQPGTWRTSPGHLAGTIAYMAPERFDSAPITAAADIFSWGLVIAYAGTGRHPFAADAPSAIAGRILTQRPDLTGLPEPLVPLVSAALAKDPAARPNARTLLDLLLAAQSSSTHNFVPGRMLAAGRRRIALAAATVLLLAGGGVAAAALHSSAAPPKTPVEPTGGTSILSDPLSRTGQWNDLDFGSEHASCKITDKMTASRPDRGVTLCFGPDMHLNGTHSIAVDLILNSPGSCSAIWFFWNPEHGGWVMRFCKDSVQLALDRAPDRRILGTIPLTQPIEIGKPATVRIVAGTDRADVFRDHKFLGSFPLAANFPKDGTDTLGLSVETLTEKGPYSVSYANVDVRTF